MPTQSKRGRAPDRAKVAGGQDHEARGEAERNGWPKRGPNDTVKGVRSGRLWFVNSAFD